MSGTCPQEIVETLVALKLAKLIALPPLGKGQCETFSSSLPESESLGRRIARRSCAAFLLQL